jgi:hypothetical protein
MRSNVAEAESGLAAGMATFIGVPRSDVTVTGSNLRSRTLLAGARRLEETTLKVDYAVESDDSSGNVASITSKLEEVSAGNGAAKSELATSLGDAVGDATGTTVAFTVDGVVSVDVVATAAPTSSTEAEIPRPPPLPSTEVEESSAPLALAAALILTETSA